MSAYRDRPLQCARCRLELRRDGARDIWTCSRCGGALVAVEELIKELAHQVPSLVPDSGAKDITTLGRRTLQLVTCPSCSDSMEPVFLGGVEIDRCYHDQQFWLDTGETGQILARAHEQERTDGHWLADRIRRLFGFGPW